MGGTELALAIAKASKLRGEFRLRSGAVTTEYFDKYRFEADPALLRAITDSLVTLVPSATDALAGLELGAVPLATALTLRTGLPAIFVRKRPKEYGTCRLAEGGTSPYLDAFAIGVLSVLSGTPSTILVTAWGPSPGTEREYTL